MTELDNAIYLLGRVILSASRQDALASRVDLGHLLSSLGEIPDVASDGAFSWAECQRQCGHSDVFPMVHRFLLAGAVAP